MAAPFGQAEALLPGCRSIVVLGSGGSALWQDLAEAVRSDPRRLTEHDHPLEDHVQRRVEEADPHPLGRRWLYAADPRVPMQELALQAGLGTRSRLWLILHPHFGPWMALRAACLTTEVLPLDGPAQHPSPCEACSAPCVAACPAEALSQGDLDWSRCIDHQATVDRCAPLCHSRRACPEGAQHAYSALQQAYHRDPRAGRPAVASWLGVSDDRTPPAGRFTRLLRQRKDELDG